MNNTHKGLAIGVFGVPGVGKSTLIRAFAELYPPARGVVGSSYIKAVLHPHSVRDMDGWPADRQREVRELACARLVAERDGVPSVLLVDGHYTLRNRETGRLAESITDADRALYAAMVLVDSTAEQVVAQRSADGTRTRSLGLEEVREHLALERAVAQRTAHEMGHPFYRVAAASLDDRLRELAATVCAIEEGRS